MQDEEVLAKAMTLGLEKSQSLEEGCSHIESLRPLLLPSYRATR